MTPIFAMLFFTLFQASLENKLIAEYCSADTTHKIPCPRCGSEQTIKNGSTHNGKAKNQCKSCGRQFVINPSKKSVSEEIKQLIDKLLLERISLRGIQRVTGVSWSWLQDYVNNKFSQVPRQIKVSRKPKGKLIIALLRQTGQVDFLRIVKSLY